MTAATKIGDGTDLSVAMIAWGRNAKFDPSSPRTRLESGFGKLLLPAVRSKADASANPFVANRPHPTGEPPCRVRQVGEAVSSYS